MRKVFIAITIMVLFLIALLLFVAFRPLPQQWMLTIMSLIVILASGTATGFVFNNVVSIETEERIPWLLLGLGTLAICIADIIYMIYEVVLRQDPNASLADLFYMVMYPLFLWAMISQWRNFGLSIKQLWRRLSIPTILGILIASFSITQLMIPIFLSEGQLFVKILSLIYLIFDVITIIGAGYLIFALWGGASSVPWILIAAGIITTSLADSLYFYTVTVLTEYPDMLFYILKDLADIVYIIASLFILFGAYINRLIFEGELI